MVSKTDSVVRAIIRFTGGNFRLLMRLLTQMKRVVAISLIDPFQADFG